MTKRPAQVLDCDLLVLDEASMVSPNGSGLIP